MTRSLSLVVWALVLGSAAAAAPLPADLVLLHGKIHTEDARRSVVEAMALRGNGIVAVGTDEAIAAFIGPSTQQVDLAGRVVLPGIIDAHTHPAESSQDFGKCNLEDVMLTIAQLGSRLAACLQTHPVGHDQWFDAVNVNQSGLTLELKDLDAILPDRCWRALTDIPSGRIQPPWLSRTSPPPPRILPEG